MLSKQALLPRPTPAALDTETKFVHEVATAALVLQAIPTLKGKLWPTINSFRAGQLIYAVVTRHRIARLAHEKKMTVLPQI